MDLQVVEGHINWAHPEQIPEKTIEPSGNDLGMIEDCVEEAMTKNQSNNPNFKGKFGRWIPIPASRRLKHLTAVLTLYGSKLTKRYIH